MAEVNPAPDMSYQNMNIRDLEERQRTLKDRLILVGQNLIDFKEKTEDELLELKKDIEILKNSMEKIKLFIETLSAEFSKFAKKEDLDILTKQAKMFQPMNFVTKKELEEMKKEKTHHKS
jgi:hypothetical protein